MKLFHLDVHLFNDYINNCDTTTVQVHFTSPFVVDKEMIFTNDIESSDVNEIVKCVLNKLDVPNARYNMYWDQGGYDLDWYNACYEVFA